MPTDNPNFCTKLADTGLRYLINLVKAEIGYASNAIATQIYVLL